MTREEVLQAIANNQTIRTQNLTGIDLAGADLTGGRFENVSFHQADLRGINILKTGLKNCDFSGAHLDGTDLRSVNLNKMNFAGASMQGVQLHKTQLQHADLSGANFQNTLFSWTLLQHANLEGANLQGCRFEKVVCNHASLKDVNLEKADLTKAVFRDCDMTGVRFAGCRLHKVYLGLCNLRGQNFAGARFSTVNVDKSNLQKADFRGAFIAYSNFMGADLTEADMEGVQGAGANITFLNVLELKGTSITIDTGETGGDLEFYGALDGGLAVTLTAGTGDLLIGLNGDIGAIDPLLSLSISAKNLNLHDVTTIGSQTFASAGTITTNSTYTSAGGAIEFDGNVVINDEVQGLVIDTTDGGKVAAGAAVTFKGDVDSTANKANGLTVTAGAGTVTFESALGSADDGELGAIDIDTAGLSDFQSTIEAASIDTDAAGTVQLAGNVTVTGAAGAVFNENVTIAQAMAATPLVIEASDTDGVVTFGADVDSASGKANALTVNAGDTVTFTGAVGSTPTAALGALKVNTAGLTDFKSTVLADSVVTDQPGEVALGGYVTVTGAAGAIFNENLTLMKT